VAADTIAKLTVRGASGTKVLENLSRPGVPLQDGDFLVRVL
jgi:hypothetical protein